MSRKSQTTFAALAAAVALVVAAPAAQAKHGGLDDGVVELRHGADDALRNQDDRTATRREAEARNGADDPAGDDRGGKQRGRGDDDGPNHG